MIEFVYGPQGGILWIDAVFHGQKMSLGGYCRYWIDGNTFGGFSCSEHAEYGAVSYTWNGLRFVKGYQLPSSDVEVFEGEWLSDAEWNEVRR